MADKNVAVTLTARVDAFVSAMQRAAASTNQFATQTDNNLKKVGGQLQSFGRGMSVMVTAPIVAAGAAGTKMAADYQFAFSRMVGLANVPREEVDKLSKSVKALAGETGRAPTELAAGLYEAASAGLSASEAMEAIEVAARGAAVGLGTTDDVSGLAASAISAYGRENMNAAKAVDILVATIREGRAAPEELAKTMGRMLAPAAQLGVSFEEVGAAVAYVSNVFGDTFRTVSGVQDMFIKLQAPAQSSIKILEEMGTSYEELRAAIDERGLLGALQLLRDHGFAENERALRRLMPDTHGYNALITLLNDNAGTLDRTLDRLAGSQGALDDAWAAWTETDAAQLAQAWGRVQVALLEVGLVILPIFADIIDMVADVASAFAALPEPIQEVVVAFGGLLALVGPMAIFAGAIVRNATTIAAALGLMRSGAIGAAAADGLGAVMGGAAAGAGGGSVLGTAARIAPWAIAAAKVASRAAPWAAAYTGLYSILPKDSGPLNQKGVREGAKWWLDVAADVGDEVHRWATFRDLRQAAARMFRDEFTPEVRGVLAPNFEYGPWVGAFGGAAWDTKLRDAGMRSRLASMAAGVPAVDQEVRDFVRFEQIASQRAFRGPRLPGMYGRADFTAIRDEKGEIVEWEGRREGKQVAFFDTAFKDQINAIVGQGQAMAETLNKMRDGARAYQDAVRSTDWGRAEFEGATNALTAYHDFMFGGLRQTAVIEGTMDELADALKETGDASKEAGFQFDLTSEKGRRAFSAVQEVAAAFEPKMREAWESSGGSVDEFTKRLEVLREDFIKTAMNAGIGEERAKQMADAVGLIPENAQTIVELIGQEDARLKIQLLQTAIEGLPPTVRTEVEQQIIEGDYQGALQTIQSFYDNNPAEVEADAKPGDFSAAENALNNLTDEQREAFIDAVGGDESAARDALMSLTEEERQAFIDAVGGDFGDAVTALTSLTGQKRQAAIDAIMGRDGASRVLDWIARSRTSYITVVATTKKLTGEVEKEFDVGGRKIRDVGGYVSSPENAILAYDGRPEVVLPLTRPDRIRALVSDPRVSGPLFSALGYGGRFSSGGGSSSMSTSASPSFDVRVFLGNQELRDMVRVEIHERGRELAMGSRFR